MFLKKFQCANLLAEEDLENWVRRYNKSSTPSLGGGLKYADLVGCFQTMTPYVRLEDPTLKKLEKESILLQD